MKQRGKCRRCPARTTNRVEIRVREIPWDRERSTVWRAMFLCGRCESTRTTRGPDGVLDFND